MNRKLYAPFTKVIFTPDCFYENIGKNQLRFKGYMELFYLHPSRFKPNRNFNEIIKKEKVVLLRFVSWEVFHNIGQKGLSSEEKIKLTKLISKKYDVFISSESELPSELEQYKLKFQLMKSITSLLRLIYTLAKVQQWHRNVLC